MNDILTFNQSIFGTKYMERRTSRRAKKAQAKELYTPSDSDIITYDEGYDIDGGAVLQIAGVAGYVVSIVCQAILAFNDVCKLGINFFWKQVLKITAFCGTVLSIAGGISCLAGGKSFSIVSTILQKIGCGKAVADLVAAGTKMHSFFSTYFEMA